MHHTEYVSGRDLASVVTLSEKSLKNVQQQQQQQYVSDNTPPEMIIRILIHSPMRPLIWRSVYNG